MKKEAQAALLSLSLVLTGCGPDAQPKPVAPSNPAAAATFTPTEAPYSVYAPLSSDEIKAQTSQYFPELNNMLPKESGMFKTDKGTVIRWLNYTDGKFNEEAAKAMFSYMEILPKITKGQPQTRNYEGKNETFSLDEGTSKERVVFIVPKDAKFPTGAPNAASSSTESPNGEIFVSFIRYASDYMAAFVIASEACFQAIVVKSGNKEFSDLIERQLCISAGAMHASRYEELSYEEYVEKFQGFPVGSYPFNFVIFSKDSYEDSPDGKILTGISAN